MKTTLEKSVLTLMGLTGAYSLGFAVLCSENMEQFIFASFLGMVGICGTLVILTTKN